MGALEVWWYDVGVIVEGQLLQMVLGEELNIEFFSWLLELSEEVQSNGFIALYFWLTFLFVGLW